MYTRNDECHLFGILRNSLLTDLCNIGLPQSVAGAILNWFDPANEDYLLHVDSWQTLLCKGAIERDEKLPQCPALIQAGIIEETAFGTLTIMRSDAIAVKAVHQIARLVIKYKGIPRRQLDLSEAANRFRRPGRVTLFQHEIQGIKDALSCVTLPTVDELCGRFGPGSTADSLSQFDRWSRKGSKPSAIDDLIFFANQHDLEDSPKLSSYRHGITKIREVPKSLKSNRLISSEPAMGMFAQLAVANALDDALREHFSYCCSLHNQEKHNTRLLQHQSCSIDLSDASDHVSVRLIRLILPQLWPLLAKVRSSFTQFPDGKIVPLGTFAPMGSGVCFPVLTLVNIGICKYACRFPFSVYGDDIIVHVRDYDYVCTLLQRAGLVLNKQKSSNSLCYRESCGCEMFKSMNITPVLLRCQIEQTGIDKLELLVGQLTDGFLFVETAERIVRLALAGQLIRGTRYNKQLQRREVLVRSERALKESLPLSEWAGLNRWFCIKAESSDVNAKTVRTKSCYAWKSEQDYPVVVSHWFDTKC